MQRLAMAFTAICSVGFLILPLSAFAASPQPGILQISLASKTVSLGEPLVLVYKLTNVENQGIGSNINENPYKWLRVGLVDPSIRSLGAVVAPNLIPPHSGLSVSQESTINANGSSGDSVTGSIVISQMIHPTHPGYYQLRLSAHQTYYWQQAPGETVAVNQDFLLPVTITARDPQKLHSVAEKLRQSILHDNDYGLAVKALFAMHDPDCLPVWRELAIDPSLDASRATDVINALVEIGTQNAGDILAEMQTVAPERWRRTGLDPLNALEDMRRTASPELKQHINELLVAAGVDLHHVPYGSVN